MESKVKLFDMLDKQNFVSIVLEGKYNLTKENADETFDDLIEYFHKSDTNKRDILGVIGINIDEYSDLMDSGKVLFNIVNHYRAPQSMVS
jgi:hypothetical protein